MPPRPGGEDAPGLESGKFLAPHGLAINSNGDIYVDEVAYNNWPSRFGEDVPTPKWLQKLEKLL